MTAIVALSLAFLFFGLKPIHMKNEAVYNKKAILSAVAEQLPVEFSKISDEEVSDIFNNDVEQMVLDMQGNVLTPEQVAAAGYPGGKAEDVDMKQEKKKPEADRILPLYVYTTDSGEKYYIVSVRGNGLWDEIWGNIALKQDLSTIAGVAFDHVSETPGLGAEIKDNPSWKAQFKGKEIYDESGKFTSIDIVKGGARDDNPHAVDGLTGATITANGVDAMLERGLKYYEPYFEKID